MNCLLILCRNTSGSVINSAMSSELQVLEALKNESLLHCKIVQQVEELNKRHVQKCDALRQEQYQKLVRVVKPSPISLVQFNIKFPRI